MTGPLSQAKRLCNSDVRLSDVFNEKIWQNGGGQVVSVLAFYSDDPSSNPSTVFSVKFVFEKTKLDKKRLRLAHLKNFDKNANVNF